MAVAEGMNAGVGLLPASPCRRSRMRRQRPPCEWDTLRGSLFIVAGFICEWGQHVEPEACEAALRQPAASRAGPGQQARHALPECSHTPFPACPTAPGAGACGVGPRGGGPPDRKGHARPAGIEGDAAAATTGGVGLAGCSSSTATLHPFFPVNFWFWV